MRDASLTGPHFGGLVVERQAAIQIQTSTRQRRHLGPSRSRRTIPAALFACSQPQQAFFEQFLGAGFLSTAAAAFATVARRPASDFWLRGKVS